MEPRVENPKDRISILRREISFQVINVQETTNKWKIMTFTTLPPGLCNTLCIAPNKGFCKSLYWELGK